MFLRDNSVFSRLTIGTHANVSQIQLVPSSVAPNEPRDRQTWSVDLGGEQTDHNVDVSWKTRFKGEDQRNR